MKMLGTHAPVLPDDDAQIKYSKPCYDRLRYAQGNNRVRVNSQAEQGRNWSERDMQTTGLTDRERM
jgi:hypothetical protein